MSAGTPNWYAYMRPRHSQEYASGSDDLEDDACWKTQESHYSSSGSWIMVIANVLWIASAAFIVYVGDRRSNLFSLLCRDDRLNRLALNLGLVCIILNGGIVLCAALFTCIVRKANEKWELSASTPLPVMTILGLLSFFLLTFALWPIWGFLTLPLLFTLFMAVMVTTLYIASFVKSMSPIDIVRAD